MEEIGAILNEIDKMNAEVLNLINKYVSNMESIAKFKNSGEKDFSNLLKETTIMENIIKMNNGPLPDDLVKEVLNVIIKTILQYLGVQKNNKSLIISRNDGKFLSVSDIFNIPPGKRIIIAGPCSIENRTYLEEAAILLKQNSLKILRAGAYKPRTSPYDFQGLREEGLKILKDIGCKYNLYTVTEVVDPRDIDVVIRYTDVLQVGARNMFNYELLKEVGKTNHPIILKRGMCATIQELLYAAEYIAIQGNRKIILCERGIRTFDTNTRNTLDISCIPIIKKECTLPIIADLSHSLGRKDIIYSIAKAVLAVGADGIMVELHPCPELALSDNKQQLNPHEFIELVNTLNI